MIPHDFITEWRSLAPWVSDFQVEQDLVISRALVALFANPVIAQALAFRGGTALYKLHITPAPRYSEDIDLVQVRAGAIGEVMEAERHPMTRAPAAAPPRRTQGGRPGTVGPPHGGGRVATQ